MVGPYTRYLGSEWASRVGRERADATKRGPSQAMAIDPTRLVHFEPTKLLARPWPNQTESGKHSSPSWLVLTQGGRGRVGTTDRGKPVINLGRRATPRSTDLRLCDALTATRRDSAERHRGAWPLGFRCPFVDVLSSCVATTRAQRMASPCPTWHPFVFAPPCPWNLLGFTRHSSLPSTLGMIPLPSSVAQLALDQPSPHETRHASP